MVNRRVGVRAVRATMQGLLSGDPEAPVTIEVAKGATTGIVAVVADAVRDACQYNVTSATDKG